MESLISFIKSLSKEIEDFIKQASECIGKEVVDSSAVKKGIVIDRVKDYNGKKVSLLGYDYTPEEISKINKTGDDVLACIGQDGRFFISMDDVSAIGSLVLIKSKLNLPEIKREAIREKERAMRKYNLLRETFKKAFPSIKPPEIKEKGWLDRIMGE